MPATFDLAVLGAGCAGVAAAREGARLGLGTVLLDPQPPVDPAGLGLEDVAVVTGRGRLDGPGRILASTGDGDQAIAAARIVLATGRRPATSTGLAPDGDRIAASEDLLTGADRPQTILVLGAGACGVAAAGALARLGHRVTLVEMRERILPEHDADGAAAVAGSLARDGVRLLAAHRAVKAAAQGTGVAVELLDVAAREPVAESADHVLLCLGHRPRSRELGLDTVTVETDRRGHVLVDAHLQTTTAGLYAVGGLVPTLPGPVVAALEGRTAAAHAAGRPGPPLRYRDLPRQVGGPFPLAVAGPGEDQARAEGYAVGVGTAARPPAGWAKVLADRETGRLLGVGLAGPGAGELISEAALAIEMAATATDLRLTIHPHPTLSESIMEAAESLYDPGK